MNDLSRNHWIGKSNGEVRDRMRQRQNDGEYVCTYALMKTNKEIDPREQLANKWAHRCLIHLPFFFI